MNRRLKNILLNNWTLTAIVSLVIILIFHPVKNKFLAKVENKKLIETGKILKYSDLDGDGISEKIVLETNQKGNGSIKIYNPLHLGQWNSKNKIPERHPYFLTEDTDSNGFKEIYFLGLRNDSIFVNRLDLKKPGNPEEFFIDRLPAESDAILKLEQAIDLDNDGYMEILLNIRGGFIHQPRKIYALNIHNRLVLKTPLCGSKVKGEIIQDIDNDGFIEIIDGTFATRNYEKDEIPYSDQFSWVMVFNNKLDFKFKPIKISNKKTAVKVATFRRNNEQYILACLNIKNNSSSFLKYKIINAGGKMIFSDSIPEEKRPYFECNLIPIILKQEKVLLLTPNGTCCQMNNDFKFQKKWVNRELSGVRFIDNLDITGNKKKETILNVLHSSIYYIADENFRHFSKIDLPSVTMLDENISLKHDGTGKTKLVIQKNEEVFYITYRKNPLWNFRFIVWGAIPSLIYILIWAIQAIQKERMKVQFQTQQQIRELQFKAITSQLNPHFMFNALNTISNSIYDTKNPEAYDRFTTFSRLIRNILNNSDKIARTLEEEILFTEDFLKIQKLRFKEAFNYTILVGKNVNTKCLVPKLIIQIFVENAVKHAFPANYGKDKIAVKITAENELLKIEIEDNGIGRKAARLNQTGKMQDSTGMGLRVMQQFITLLNKQNQQKISFSITDLYDSEKPSGTKITVSVPGRYRYNVI